MISLLLDANADVGLVGPRLACNGDRSLQVSCFPFPTPQRAWAENLGISRLLSGPPLGDYRRWAHDEECEVAWVSGRLFAACGAKSMNKSADLTKSSSCTLKRRIGSARNPRRGDAEIAFTPKAVVVHLGAARAEAPRRSAQNSTSISFRALTITKVKHHRMFGLIAVRAAMVTGSSLRFAGWLGVMIALPAKRAAAMVKLRLLCWLMYRQLTCWRVA